jgi:hypothetical protein|tara:strand:+ start:196 stop:315 length:120 start_codon:yes stop_codon:yes gene_type:complete
LPQVLEEAVVIVEEEAVLVAIVTVQSERQQAGEVLLKVL